MSSKSRLASIPQPDHENDPEHDEANHLDVADLGDAVQDEGGTDTDEIHTDDAGEDPNGQEPGDVEPDPALHPDDKNSTAASNDEVADKKLTRSERRAAKQESERVERDAEEAERSATAEARLAEAAALEEAERITEEAREREAARPIAKLRRGFRKLMTTTALISFLAALVIAVVLGWPKLRERYLDPIDETERAVSALQTDFTSQEDRVASLEEQLASIDSMSGTELGSLSVTMEDLRGANTNLTNELAAATESLNDTNATLEGLGTRVDRIDETLATQNTRLEQLDELSVSLAGDLNDTNEAAAQQLGFIKATELLSRARLFLYQANYGLATADVAGARAELVKLSGANAAADLDGVVQRLDVVLANLPERPVAAAADLDVAWQSLLTPDAPVPSLLDQGGDSAPSTGVAEPETDG